MSKTDKLLEALLAKAFISNDTLRLLQHYCECWQVSGFRALLETHCFAEDGLADTLADVYQLKRATGLTESVGEWQLELNLPYRQARDWECLVRKQGEGQPLELVMADPSLQERRAALSKLFPSGLELVVGSRSDILQAIDEAYPVEAQIAALSQEAPL